MLLQFSVKNYKTFKDEVKLSLVASNYDKEAREEENVFSNPKFGLRLLKSVVVYGANASGKTKLIEAFDFMRYFVINSFTDFQQTIPIDVQPFLLSTETEDKPSEFEVVFIHEDILYRYGFVVTQRQVVSEWLYYKPKTKEVELFYREENNIKVHKTAFAKGKIVAHKGLVQNKALFISVAAQFNEKIAIDVQKWFLSTKFLSGLHEMGYQMFTINKVQKSEYKHKILQLLKAADIGIDDIEIKEDILESPTKPYRIPRRNMASKAIIQKNGAFSEVWTLTKHKQYNHKKQAVSSIYFDLDEEESSGTRKFFALTGPILDVLENGSVLFADELDAKLHPNLMYKIVSLFNSKEFNTKNAQLIFNTHDTNLLSSGLLRRDQIWFIDKNKYGEAKLYSLADFKSVEVRKNENIAQKYLVGKYGAVPFLGFFENLKDVLSENEK